ncbi:hypothetical protein DPMN_180105 [Dreissena polymorpha]|uniref:Uncharacterized protein n=1 Tax=Dreissena polymorpha TaxID=45954 RepID=A0A9D4EF94_DREPO|nr:hypothetical protein DPMN_180105 [Dreissena polymorpha]
MTVCEGGALGLGCQSVERDRENRKWQGVLMLVIGPGATALSALVFLLCGNM